MHCDALYSSPPQLTLKAAKQEAFTQPSGPHPSNDCVMGSTGGNTQKNLDYIKDHTALIQFFLTPPSPRIDFFPQAQVGFLS